jgi:hypothetical protein
MILDKTKINDDDKCALFVGRFDGHAGVRMQYNIHCPTEQFQGFTGSHWTLPLGACLHCILL